MKIIVRYRKMIGDSGKGMARYPETFPRFFVNVTLGFARFPPQILSHPGWPHEKGRLESRFWPARDAGPMTMRQTPQDHQYKPETRGGDPPKTEKCILERLQGPWFSVFWVFWFSIDGLDPTALRHPLARIQTDYRQTPDLDFCFFFGPSNLSKIHFSVTCLAPPQL